MVLKKDVINVIYKAKIGRSRMRERETKTSMGRRVRCKQKKNQFSRY